MKHTQRPSIPTLLLATLLPFLPVLATHAQDAEKPTNEDTTKPNIIFIMVDDLGKDWISCYGADDIETPRIDALAKTGMVFHNAYSMPQCTPSRATLLTGTYPFRNGFVNHWDVPRWGIGYFDWELPQNTTFASLMRTAGYTTAVAGKWQINDYRLVPDVMDKHGFDDWCMWTGYEAGNPPSGNRYYNAYIHTRDGSKTHKDIFGPDVYTDFLCDYIRENAAKPLCLYFPMALTHGPMTLTPDQQEKGDKLHMHKGMVRYMDKLVGRVVDAVDEAGIRDRTLIIFTTDNGTSGGLRGTIDGVRPSGGKASKYEGGCNMPFIANCPGLVPNTETHALTDFSDLLPTFCELGGADIPDDLTLDGKSFAKLLLGKADDTEREWILALGHGAATTDDKGVRGKVDYAGRVIRDKRWKVWVNEKAEIDQLYDLENDPLERTNLLDNDSAPEHAAVLAKFQAVIDWMPEKDARPAYRPRAKNPWDKAPATKKKAADDKAKPAKKSKADRKKKREKKQ